jgi:hypothetical protein
MEELTPTSVALRCPKLAASDAARFISSINMISTGAFEESLIAAGNFLYSELMALAAVDKGVREILTEARRMGNEARQILREDTADKRAIHGTKEPIYSVKGEYLGEKINYSDALLGLQLKANDPGKYRDAAAPAAGGGFILSVNLGLERDPVDRKVTVDEIKCIDVTPTLLPAASSGGLSNGETIGK